MNINITKANENDLSQILPYLQNYRLDTEELNCEDFLIVKIDGDVIGFGRIKNYEMLSELSSIGVLEEYRLNGYGSKIVSQLVKIFDGNELWLSTRSPDFFKKLGFEINDNPPIEIKGKSKRICKKAGTCSDGIFFMSIKKESG